MGQDALEREQRRREERSFVRPLTETDEDFYSDYHNDE